MKFETQSGCKLLSISLCDKREYLGLSLRNRSFGAVIRIRLRLDAMFGPIRKLIGPAKTRLRAGGIGLAAPVLAGLVFSQDKNKIPLLQKASNKQSASVILGLIRFIILSYNR